MPYFFTAKPDGTRRLLSCKLHEAVG